MATPKSAAAIVLVRLEAELEVFWVRRAPHMMFQAGFHAFPGGQLDPDEDPKVCAVRELLEETGAKVDPRALLDVGRWVTPPFYPRRFDTRFFLAFCPDGEDPRVLSIEHDRGEWIRPSDAVARWNNGEILMAPPVLHALKCLCGGLQNIEARMKAIPAACGEPTTQIEVKPGIVLVPLRTPTLPPATHTNCYVIGGDELIVIDPASPYEEEQAALDRFLEHRNIREVWLTHLHGDHIGGANHLREKRNVRVVAHPATAAALQGAVTVDRTFEPNERIELSGTPGWILSVLHTPGHARGHVCVFEERTGSLITGDLMAGFGTIVIDPPEGHMATYFDSLRRMHALSIKALLPSHGPVMAHAKTKVQEYLDHRIERERSVLEAWKSGIRDVAEIVKDVYKDVAPAMHGLAARSVEAHIEKLREEGRI